MKRILFITASLAFALSAGAQTNAPPGMALVPAGEFTPLFRTAEEPARIPVKGFFLDVLPVTNGDYLKFVRANPRWRRSQVKRLFADESYLKHWAGDFELGADTERLQRAPVTHVSWFAAKAYCDWKGKRLPTLAEWELAAAASPTLADGAKDIALQKQILQWYATPAPSALPRVGCGRANAFGVHDLHGLVWEWVADFNTAMVTSESRGDTGLERDLFCGSGSAGAKDRSNYPAFMRAGFRSSLKADYNIHNLGFRAAKDL